MGERGVEAALERARLAEAYGEFMAADEANADKAGKALIQAIFGSDAITED